MWKHQFIKNKIKKKKKNLESVYVKEPKIKQISNQMISLNTEFEVIDKINTKKSQFTYEQTVESN